MSVATLVPSSSFTTFESPRHVRLVADTANTTPGLATRIATVTPLKAALNTPSGTTSTSNFRLLYRGAISLPDSQLLLDGLTFGARLESSTNSDGTPLPAQTPSKQNAFQLLQNPLALALESMRGRPTLRFIGTVQLADIQLDKKVWMDESGSVEMDIHHHALISRIYFENMFCLLPFESERSSIGIKVALGDSDGSETTQIIIFAQTIASSTVRLRVARLCPHAEPMSEPKKKIPRPDDPIPRKPPAIFMQQGLKRSGSLSMAGVGVNELKRVASGNLLPAAKKVRMEEGSFGEAVFKVPELPSFKAQGSSSVVSAKAKGKEKERNPEREEDVFGDVAAPAKPSKEDGAILVDENALEKANKNVSNPVRLCLRDLRLLTLDGGVGHKKATTEYLGKTKDPTGKAIDKTHPDFKDLYTNIYRGACFALRGKMRASTLDLRVLDRLIDQHAMMYFGGHGGTAQAFWG